MRDKPTMKLSLAGALAVTAFLAFPALAGAHATVSPFQPQTTPLTAARTLYVLRVPNEKPAQPTFKVIMYVPTAAQERISVGQSSDWRVRLTRKNTGRKDAEGAPVYAITAISWTARRGAEIDPHFFGDFFFRIQNPTAASRLCFPTLQYYRAEGDNGSSRRRRGRKRNRPAPEVVKWTGPPEAEFPASCVNVVTGPPAG
jgi:uncharacterized protein YcnI